MVRVRHQTDSRINSPGERSRVLWPHYSLGEKRDQAYALAREAAERLKLPLHDSLDASLFWTFGLMEAQSKR